jgi:hypothetical protein
MTETITRKLLVVGGSGFFGMIINLFHRNIAFNSISTGLNVCKLAVQRGWETVSLRYV